jgi:Mn-containing catalase
MALVAVGEVLDILGVMEETEKAIADLYGRFGRTWPDEETLWLNMAGEEVGHVEIIGRLKALIAAAPDNFQLNRRFIVTALRTFLEGI